MTDQTHDSRGDLLVQQILDGAAAESGALENDLLSEFWSGYPIERLRPFLRHSDPEIVEAGAFLAEELPGLIGPVMEDILPLLDHASSDVRFSIVGVVLDNVIDDGETIARALLAIRDTESGVRWMALRFALLADQGQLESALPFLAPDVRAALAKSGLLDRDAAAVDDWRKVRNGLEDRDELVRRWAAAAAARFAHRELLADAADSSDPDVSHFAGRELKRLTEFGPANPMSTG